MGGGYYKLGGLATGAYKVQFYSASYSDYCGRILDANAANGGRIKPLVGATVCLMTSPIINATTDERGYFLMASRTHRLPALGLYLTLLRNSALWPDS